jgi:hypothetical protein
MSTDAVSRQTNEIRKKAGWDGKYCTTCGKPIDRPFYSKDERGHITMGCIDSAHADDGNGYRVAGYNAWFNRPASKKLRTETLDHLLSLGTKKARRPASGNQSLYVLHKRLTRKEPHIWDEVGFAFHASDDREALRLADRYKDRHDISEVAIKPTSEAAIKKAGFVLEHYVHDEYFAPYR